MSKRTVLITCISILISSACGFGAGYLFTKNKFQDLADKEIESVKKTYEKHFSNKSCEVKETCDIIKEKTHTNTEQSNNETEKKENISSDEKNEPADETRYVNYTEKYNGSSKGGPKDIVLKSKKTTSKKIVVSEEDYEHNPEYALTSLLYYSDKVLADDDENIIKNVIEVIGENGKKALDSLSNTKDLIYVIDNDTKQEYAIYFSENTYSEVHGANSNNN